MLSRRQLLAGCVVASGCAGLTTLTASGDTVRLAFAQFPSLAAAGGSVVVMVAGRFPLLVARVTASTAAALKVC